MSVSYPVCHTLFLNYLHPKAGLNTRKSRDLAERSPATGHKAEKLMRLPTQSSPVCWINNMLQKHRHVNQSRTSNRCPAVTGAAFTNLQEMLFLFQITKKQPNT